MASKTVSPTRPSDGAKVSRYSWYAMKASRNAIVHG